MELKVIGLSGEASWTALADTGCDVTLFTDLLVPILGVDPGPEEEIAGIGGQVVVARFADVDLELQQGQEIFRWRARVGFYPRLPALLGHEGFFDLFHASFDNDKRTLTIRPHKGALVAVTTIP